MLYRLRKYSVQILAAGMILSSLLFSHGLGAQNKDAPPTDSTVVMRSIDEDSADEMIQKHDSARYNYYYNISQWPQDSLLTRKVPDSIIRKMKADDDFWYANFDFKKKDQSPAQESRNRGFWYWLSRQGWYKALAWTIIIGGFIAVLVWFLASSQVSLFRRRSKTIEGAEDSDHTENIFEMNFPKEIERAVAAGNYRMAIRFRFLQLLKNLSERNIIQYKQGSTNFDYLLQLQSSNYYKDFFRLTRNYEYTWYGEFPVSSNTYGTIKNDFENFELRL